MAHLLIIDPIEKLVVKKDSSLLLALSLKEAKHEVYLVFKDDLFISNSDQIQLKVHTFKGSLELDTFYLKSFEVETAKNYTLKNGDTLHMRLDPPFDTGYLKVLWMLRNLQLKRSLKVVNDPAGIALNNEKIKALEDNSSLPTYIGSSFEGLCHFLESLEDTEDLILKPMDLFQGIGVEKISARLSKEDLKKAFNRKILEFKGPVVAQPFNPAVTQGEVRAVYYAGKELGHILKTPPKGSYLANIAQGASFQAYSLNQNQKAICDRIAQDLNKEGVPWVAFDMIGEKVSEVNITCPGLLVELSKAHKKNLALKIIETLN